MAKSRPIMCVGCGNLIAVEDRRRKQPYKVKGGATLILAANQAPRIRCICGLVTILVKGTIG